VSLGSAPFIIRHSRTATVVALFACIVAIVGLIQARGITSFSGLLVYGLLLCFLAALSVTLLSGRNWIRLVLFVVFLPLMVVMSFVWSSWLMDVAIYRVASPSMEPAIGENSLIIIDKRPLASDLKLSRCEVVAFDYYGFVYVKRVMGLPLDRIEMRSGQLYVNGQASECPGVENRLASPGNLQTRVPANHVFLIGDNRTRSEDSRTFGPVPMNLILGRVSDVLE